MAPRRSASTPRKGQGNYDRDIPGGLPHISNAETHQTKVAVPAKRVIPPVNEHGVPDANPDAPYDIPEAGQILNFPAEELDREMYAVPVYQVDKPGKTSTHRAALCDNVLVPGLSTSSDPIQVCGRDYGRVELRILNEDANNDIRFSEDRTALLEGRGALLWHGTNSYTMLHTQDELYAIGVTAACLMSVIRITDVNN